jgi:hypothetical protein
LRSALAGSRRLRGHAGAARARRDTRLWHSNLGRFPGPCRRDAYLAQGAAALASAAIVGWLWAADKPPALRFAGLAAAIPFAAPVVLFYDFMPLGIAIAWLLVEIRRTGLRPWEKTGFAAVWLIAGLAMPVAYLAHVPLGPLAPAILLALVVARAR